MPQKRTTETTNEYDSDGRLIKTVTIETFEPKVNLPADQDASRPR